LISTFSFLNNIPGEDPYTENVVISSNWIKDYDSEYKNKTIYADFYWPYYSWYLKMNVKGMPILKYGKSYYYELENYHPNNNDNIAYNDELNKNNVDYYFCIRKELNLTEYKPIKQFGIIKLYKRIDKT
jgi:hypothetical protein